MNRISEEYLDKILANIYPVGPMDITALITALREAYAEIDRIKKHYAELEFRMEQLEK